MFLNSCFYGDLSLYTFIVKKRLERPILGYFVLLLFGRGEMTARVTDFYLFTATSERSKVRSDAAFRAGTKPATSWLTIMRPTD